MHKNIFAWLCLAVLAGCGSPGQSSLSNATTSDAAQIDTSASSRQTTQTVTPEGTAPFEARSYDGQNNNLSQPSWGSANAPFVEDVVRAYTDGQGQPSGRDRPGPRQVSNAVVAQSSVLDDPAGRSAFLWFWGQFLDHDLDLTFSNGLNDFPIPIPTGDIYFEPSGSGTQTLPFPSLPCPGGKQPPPTGELHFRLYRRLAGLWIGRNHRPQPAHLERWADVHQRRRSAPAGHPGLVCVRRHPRQREPGPDLFTNDFPTRTQSPGPPAES